MAYNWGRRVRLAGHQLLDAAGAEIGQELAGYGLPEVLAEERLGMSEFRRWAARGWLEPA